MLRLLEQQVAAIEFPQKEEVLAALRDIDLSPKSRLKLALPIIPTVLEWETEFEVGWTDSLPQVWREFKSYFRPGKKI